MTRTLISMLIVTAVVVGLCSVTPASSAREMPLMAGGFRPIAEVNAHIQELGRWAVSVHVKRVHDGLVFSKVVSGEEQVVAGMEYRLVTEVTKGGVGTFSLTYVVVVWEKADRAHTRLLLSFNQAK